MDRRTFLADLSRSPFFCRGIPNVWRVTGRPLLQSDPFTLGVASGDPLQHRCVIWTRLAPSPLEVMGGMTGQRTVVGREVAYDEAFSRIVRQGEYTAAPELGYSVHGGPPGEPPCAVAEEPEGARALHGVPGRVAERLPDRAVGDRAGAPIETRSSWRVERGRGGIERI